jgi:hypothetical protein
VAAEGVVRAAEKACSAAALGDAGAGAVRQVVGAVALHLKRHAGEVDHLAIGPWCARTISRSGPERSLNDVLESVGPLSQVGAHAFELGALVAS